jgi:peptide/nickel transport system ATP-binding protein
MTETEPIARVRDLVVDFAGDGGSSFRALHGVDLDIRAGEILALVGESGSGKTVLGNTLLGLTTETRGASVTGTVDVGGVDMVDGSGEARRWVRRHVLGAVFQDPLTSLDPMMRIGAQVCERGADRARGITALEECGIPRPDERFTQWPHMLSGGLRQRVSIAGAITAAVVDGASPFSRGEARSVADAGVPSLIIADEPTTALDVRVQAQIVALFARLRDVHGCSILLITHDLGVAAQVADRIAVMSNGEICELGEAAAVITRPQHDYTRELLASRLDVSAPFGVAPETTASAETPVLSLQHVVKRFRSHERRGAEVTVLDDVSLDLAAGGSMVLVGESGSGKSTLLRIAAGLETPSAGKVVVDPAHGRPQMIFQDARSSLTPWLSIRSQLRERLTHDGVPRDERDDRVMQLLRQVGLDERAARSRPRAMSGGQCQRAAIARALASSPSVLLCDEPVSALDASLASRVVDLLDDLRHQTGVSILMVTHDLAVAKRLASDLAVMHDGRIVERGAVRDVFGDPRHEYTRQLIAASPTIAAVAPGPTPTTEVPA